MPRRVIMPAKPVSTTVVDNSVAENINTEHKIILDTMVPRNLTILDQVDNFNENDYLYIYTAEGIPSKILAIKVGPQKVSQLIDDIGLASTADLDQLRGILDEKYETLTMSVEGILAQIEEFKAQIGSIKVDGQEIKM